MQVKTTPSNDEKIKKQFQSVQIGFLKQGTTLYKFCRENGIDKAYAFRSLRGQRTGEKAKELKKRLIDASKGKVTK